MWSVLKQPSCNPDHIATDFRLFYWTYESLDTFDYYSEGCYVVRKIIMVAAGSGPGGWAALAWVVVLGMVSGVWALPCAPGRSPACAWGVWVALGTPQYGWVGAGPGAQGPPMCPQVFFCLFF